MWLQYNIKFVCIYAEATVSQVAISWLLAQPCVSSVVIGARTLAQLEDNLRSADLSLTPEEV